MRDLVARVRRRGTVYEDWGFADKAGKGLGGSGLDFLDSHPSTDSVIARAKLVERMPAGMILDLTPGTSDSNAEPVGTLGVAGGI